MPGSRAMCECGACTTCKQRASSARYRARHPEKARESARKYRARNADRTRKYQREAKRREREMYPERVRVRELRNRRQRRYGASPELVAQLAEQQHGRCPICTRDFGVGHLDHCHSTGKIRGILCRGCNTGLGLFEDDVARLTSAIAYLNTGTIEGS